MGGPYDLQLASEELEILWDYTHNLWGLCQLWVVSVKVELSCWIPRWCWGIGELMKKIPTQLR